MREARRSGSQVTSAGTMSIATVMPTSVQGPESLLQFDRVRHRGFERLG